MTAAPAPSPYRTIKDEPGTLIWSEPLPDGGNAIVKLYRHRTLADPVKRWFVPYRAEREFGLLTLLRSAGLPCPEPLRWEHGRDRRHGRFELLATREITGARPLSLLLRKGDRDEFPDLAPLFAIARRMHASGVAHGAFYPANVLVTGDPGRSRQYFVIDFAHGRRFARGIVGRRPADFDLFDMLVAIRRIAPIDEAPAWLAGYGIAADRVRQLTGRLAGHRLGRPWRHLRRMETDAGALLDWLRPGGGGES